VQIQNPIERPLAHVVSFLRFMRQHRKNAHKLEWVTGAVADDVFRYLEAKPHLPQSKRVEHILEMLSRLGRSNGDIGDIYVLNQLRGPLKRYEWHYGLMLGSRGLRAELLFTREMSEEDKWEHRAVRFLLSLVPNHLHRLRRCADKTCQRWFFAAKSGKREFCSDNCKQHHYDSDPQMRKKKREKMRKHRIVVKELEEKRKRAIGFKGRVKLIRIRRKKH